MALTNCQVSDIGEHFPHGFPLVAQASSGIGHDAISTSTDPLVSI